MKKQSSQFPSDSFVLRSAKVSIISFENKKYFGNTGSEKHTRFFQSSVNPPIEAVSLVETYIVSSISKREETKEVFIPILVSEFFRDAEIGLH